MNSEERNLGVVMWLLCIPFPFLAPLFFLVVSQEKPRVFANSVQALGFSFFIAVLYAVVTVLSILSFGLGGLLFIIPAVLHILVPILGAVSAGSGSIYEPLVSGPVVKSLMRR